MMNHLAIYNKRYIWSVTIGCAIANLFSPMGVVDVIVGSLSTLGMLTTIYFVTKGIKNEKAKLVASTLISMPFMIPVAIELHILLNMPLLMTLVTTALGEALSMTIGAVLIYFVGKQIDFRE